jgi:hypothetical protein
MGLSVSNFPPSFSRKGHTLVLLEFVKVGSVNTADIFPESIDLTCDSSPEDLVEHCVGHVIVGATFLVLGNSECVLSVSNVTVGIQSGHTGYARVLVQGI